MRHLAALLLVACGPPDGGAGGLLVDHAAWVLAGPEDDPFPAHRPAGADCPLGGWYEESGALEVDTGTCAYFVAVQPSQVDVRAGDTIALYAYHDALTAPEPATGHIVLALDGEVVWELTVDIPKTATPYDVTVEAPADVPAGAPVALHLHNHGANTWTLLDVEVLP